jgi:hypothetical protein
MALCWEIWWLCGIKKTVSIVSLWPSCEGFVFCGFISLGLKKERGLGSVGEAE